MDLSIIIVSWNIKDKLRECLKSIRETTRGLDLKYEVFVVDNDSKDETVKMVENEFTEVFVIANNFNAGFAKANNQAIKLSQGKLVLLLNPDMRLLPHSIKGMVDFMNNQSEAGVGGCHLVSEAGDTVLQVRRFPKIKDQLAIMLKLPHLFPKVLDEYMMKDFDYSKGSFVDSIRGSFFMIKREVLDKIGLLDEGFFIWFEEVDFCKRTIEAGFKVAYNPDVKCVDYVGQSFKQIKLYPKQKMFTKSMLYYFKKHRPWWEFEILDWIRPLTLGFVWCVDMLRKK